MFAPPVVVIDRRIPRGLVAAEIARLRQAVSVTDGQLASLSARLEAEALHEGHLMVEAHRMMLRDDQVVDGAVRLIEGDELSAESAVRRVIDAICARFARIEDPYLRERGVDVEAIGERLLRTLLGLPERTPGVFAPGNIGIGSVLSPIDALHLPASGLIGFAAERGGKTSHAAIILRAFGIPFVVGVRGLDAAVRPGEVVVVDGSRGEITVGPDAGTISMYEARQARESSRREELKSCLAIPTATRDGVPIELAANIEAPSEVAGAIDLGAESVGLFRTELLYLDRPELPGEEEQFLDAVAVVGAMGGRMTTFRTLDVGGEKLPLAIKVPGGANPSLGVRAIRFSRRRPDIFRTQMRALYRASARGPIRVMFPLVSGISELEETRRACAEILADLRREGVAGARDVPIGAMIETPSAALTTDHLAASAEFFSIGTNDLLQYTFAADRDNEDVEYLYRPLHPAFLRLLKSAIDGARAAGRPISVCGDMAGDPAVTWVLLGLGVRSLSMAPRFLPVVKSIICGSVLSEMEALAERAMSLRSEVEVEDVVLEVMHRRFPQEVPDRVRPTRSDF